MKLRFNDTDNAFVLRVRDKDDKYVGTIEIEPAEILSAFEQMVVRATVLDTTEKGSLIVFEIKVLAMNEPDEEGS